MSTREPPTPPLPPTYAPAGWLAEQLDVLPRGRVLVLYPGRGQLLVELASRGWQVAYADRYASGIWWARSHSAPMPSERRIRSWLKLSQEPEIMRRFAPWAHRYFSPEATVWLGVWHHHLVFGDAPEAERAAGIAAVFRAMAYWLSWRGIARAPAPSAAEVFRRMLRPGSLSEGAIRPAQTSPEAAVRALRGDLLFCYVPPVGGIEGLGLAMRLWEQWTGGDPHGSPAVRPGTLGGIFADAPQHQAAVTGLLGEGTGFSYAALATVRGESVEAPGRTLLFRQEPGIPYPASKGSSIISQGLLVVGQAPRAESAQ